MKIAYTLSGGAAYGYAHIGVLKYLEENDIRPSAIAGTSMGAIVGGLYAYGYDAGQIEQIAEHVRSLELVRLFFPSFPRGGIIDTDGIRDFFHGFIQDVRIEELPTAFRSVAVDINSGEEIIFDRGRLIDAMIASMSIPAVFKPYHYQGRFLVDGGLVNNLPWDIAQEMGDVNIVVDVAPMASQLDPERVFTSDIVVPGALYEEYGGDDSDKKHRREKHLNRLKNDDFRLHLKKLIKKIQNGEDMFSVRELASNLAKSKDSKKDPQGLPEIVTRMMAIVNEYTQKPPQRRSGKTIYLHTDLMEYSLNDFHKADEIIECGYQTAAEDPDFVKEIRKLVKKLS